MFGFNRTLIPIAVFELDRPFLRCFIIGTAVHARTHLDFAAVHLHFGGGRLPHHARTSARVTEGIDQRLNNFGPVAVFGALRKERVLDRAPERETANALRGPICRNLFAAHSPNFFGVALEENVEEAFAELIADPFLEVLRMADWEKSRFEPR